MKYKHQTIIFIIFLFFSVNTLAQNNNYSQLLWKSIGPTFDLLKKYNFVGKTFCVISNPSDTSELYAGASTGGFWKSNNGGLSWRCTTNNLPGGITDIAIHLENHNIIFATTGVFANGLIRNGFYGFGIYKSIDRGETWEVLDMNILPQDGIFFSKIIFHPLNSEIIYALSYKSIYKSKNSGKDWKKLSLQAENNQLFKDIIILESNPEMIFISGQEALYKSTNSGRTWKNIYNDIVDYKSRIEIEIAENDTIYAFCTGEKKNYDFIKKSADYGKTWISYENILNGRSFTLSMNICNNIVYAGGQILFKSNNYGNDFKKISDGIHPDIQDIHFPIKNNPNIVYIATDGGISKTIDGGKTWKNLNKNLNITQCYDIAISEIDTNLILTGAHDNGTYKFDSTGFWRHIYGGDGGSSLIDYSDPSRYYVTCNRSIIKFYENKRTKLDVKLAVVYNGCIMQDIRNPATIYTACFYKNVNNKKQAKAIIQKSDDNGSTFQDPTYPFASDWGIICAIAQSKSDTDIFFFATYDHWTHKSTLLTKSVDNGKTWSKKNDKYTTRFIAHSKISDIEFDNNNSEKVWLSFDGFIDTLKVLQSVNGGESWENIAYNLPNIPVYTIEYYEIYDLLLLGTEFGVFYLDEKNKKWRKFGKGLPTCMVSDIKINYRTNKIFISTYGRGLWELNFKNKK